MFIQYHIVYVFDLLISWFIGCSLKYINLWRLFKTKSFLYIYIKYICFVNEEFLGTISLNESEVMLKMLDCWIIVPKLELQSRSYVHFLTNILGKGMNLLILP